MTKSARYYVIENILHGNVICDQDIKVSSSKNVVVYYWGKKNPTLFKTPSEARTLAKKENIDNYQIIPFHRFKHGSI